VHELLAELTREAVLRVGSDGFRFAHDDVQTTLYAELDSKERALSHTRLAEEIAAGRPTEPGDQLRASLHFLRAGDTARCHQMLKPVGESYRSGSTSTLITTAPLIEEIYLLLKQQ